MSDFQVNLVESELKIILEALAEVEKRMSEICETSSDEDEVAEIGNDLIALRLLLNPLKKRAIDEYGENVVDFSRDLL